MLSAMFSFHGRIGRMQYFLRSMALGAAIGVVAVIGCVSLIGGGGLEALRNGQAPAGGSLVLIALLALIALPAAFWSSFSLQARRFRDIGWNPIIVMPAWIVVDMIDFIVAKAIPAIAVGKEHQGTAFGASSALCSAAHCCSGPAAAKAAKPMPRRRPSLAIRSTGSAPNPCPRRFAIPRRRASWRRSRPPRP
jgi:uncharacterized membrane protein YhaH (DUF805 family)